MNSLLEKARYAKKLMAYLGTLLAGLVAMGALEGDLEKYALAALAVLGGLGIYKAENEALAAPESEGDAA